MAKSNESAHKTGTLLLALVVMALWGSLFPMIKIGYATLHISSGDIPSIVLFAGLRFTVSGLLLLGFFIARDRSSPLPTRRQLPLVISGALATIILQYSLSYIGIALGEGSKSAIIKQMGYLFLSCFAFLFDKSDRFTPQKAVAGALGFAGIVATAFDGSGVYFGIGDLLLLVASACSAYGAVISKRATHLIAPTRFVAHTQLLGGAFLLSVGLLLGGRIGHIDLRGVLVFLYICAASIVAYVLWNYLLKQGSLSRLSVIKFTEPLFAVLFSGVLIGERILRLSYLVAFLLMLAALLAEHFPRKSGRSLED